MTGPAMPLFLSTGLLTPFALTSADRNDVLPLRIPHPESATPTLSRKGYVIVGDLLIPNGSFDTAIRLGTHWPVLPAADLRYMLVVRDGSNPDEREVELVDQTGGPIESQTVNGEVLGQLSTGELLTWSPRDGYVATDWTGVGKAFDIEGTPIALIAGRSLATAIDQTLLMTNLITGETWDAVLDIVPERIVAVYDETAERAAVVQQYLGVLIIGEQLIVRQLIPGNCIAATWTHTNHLILGTADEFGAITRGFDFDVEDDSMVEIDVPGGVFPLCDVTDRWNVEQIVAQEMQQFESAPPSFDELKAKLTDSVMTLGIGADSVSELCDRCIGFRLRLADQDELPVGATRFGGVPDLPIHRASSTSPWISYGDRPYSFFAQLRCDELRMVLDDPELPHNGWFVVWVQLSENGTYTDDEFAVNVEYHGDQPLERVAIPEELAENLRFPSMEVSMRPQLTLLPWDELTEAVGAEAAMTMVDHLRSAWPDHRLFGQPDLGPQEARDFLMKIASDETLGLFLRGEHADGWLEITIPDHLPLLEALSDTTVQTLDK
jgi:hypothetical protein